MAKYLGRLVLVSIVLVLLSTGEIKADTSSTGYIDTASSPSVTTASSNSSTSSSSSQESSTTTKNSSVAFNNSTAAKPAATITSTGAFKAENSSSTIGSDGAVSNTQAASVQVEPFSGSADLSIPFAVPAGRAGIQPNLALTYSSSNRQLGNAGIGWTLDLGSIQISSKKGIPKYDGTDIFTMEQAGATQDLVADPNTAGLYHMEVEGAFANIRYYTTYWVITDKKGIKYYYGDTNDSKQYDPANTSHIFRWALNRVEDLNGNYMTISYLNDQGQIYPQTISYTGNDQSSLILSTYAQVSISYVSASSPSISYISKFLVKTAQRIDHITISVGSNVQSVYTFTYHQSANSQRDLLQSVQQAGADGSTTLPPVTFTYNEALPQWQLASGWNIPSNAVLNMTYTAWNLGTTGLIDSGVRFMDVNGDGYPDIVQNFWGTGGLYVPNLTTPPPAQYIYTYLNSKNNGWTSTSQWNSPIYFSEVISVGSDMSLMNYATVSADFNGDGLTDIAQALDGYGSNTPAFYINNPTTESFNQDSTWSLPSGIYFAGFSTPNFHLTGVVVGDVTGNGFPDLVQSVGSTQAVYINQYPQGSKSFAQNTSFTFPSSTYTDFTQGAQLVDLTGDGLADIIYLKGGVLKAFLNNGSGWTETGDFENIQGVGDLTNLSTQVVDVNGDGLPDLVITSNGNRANATILLNTGSGWSKYQGNIGDFNFFDYGTQFLDANADGMQGYLTYESGGSPELYLNANKPVDLLVGVNNGIGASTTITYDSDFHYQNTYMPYFIPVVQSTTTTVGSQSYTTTYNYAGGLWDKIYHEFDGFQTVKLIDSDGNYVTTTFLQDHWLKGHPSEADTYDSNGNLYKKSVNQWQTQTIVTNNNFIVGGAAQTSKFLYISRTDNYLYDGNNAATPKRTAQEFTYGENPQYGDLTQVINDGQVDPVAGTSIDPNKTTTQITYVNNTSNWILGLPATTTTQDINSNTISKTSFYYDGDTTGSAVPVLGRLTAKVNWLGSTTQADPKTTYIYDGYGNLQKTIDPNGNTITITYDNTVHMLPEKTTNALSQSIMMAYYGVDGVSLNSGGLQGLWGQEASKTDPNNQTAYTTYDVFGRPLSSISPLDSVTLPTEQKSYNIQSNYIEVTDTARVANGSSATVSTTSFYDGFGRLLETKFLGPTAGQYIASGQTVYDNRGLPVTKYLPYFTSNNLDTLDSINTSLPAAQVTYDPMGRVITKTNPDGTHSSVIYNQWMMTTTDENGHMQQSFVDAFGRLIQKEEYAGADGRSSYYPSAPYTLYATTSYSYNPQGNLTSVMDAHNNVTTITYDHLGRKIGMNDPDMGAWQYGYDGNGNLIWQKDAKGQVISFTYDALNRLTNKTDAISGPIVNLPNITPQPATFNVNYHFDDHSQNFGIGRLGSVSYDTGTAGFIYDQLGREVSSNKNIGAGNYNVNRQYDALNRLQQLQYPDGSQVAYVYNQAGQVSGVADAAAVINGKIALAAPESKTSNDRLAWVDKVLGINNAYAQSNPPISNLTVTYPANPNGQIWVNFLSTQTLSSVTVQVAAPSAPNTWYTLSGNYSFMSDGDDMYTVSLPANGFPPYTLVKIDSQTPQQIFYTVAASAGISGTISPSGSEIFSSGASQTFTVTPNDGYNASMTVDGSSVTLSNNSYTLSNITAVHTIAVSFTSNNGISNMTVTYPANPNGQIVVNFSSTQALINSSVTVKVAAPSAPNTWYTLSGNYSFISDGNNAYTVSLPANSFPAYTLVMINNQSPQQVLYTVATSAGTGGTISPTGSINVISGSNQTITVTPNTGYNANMTVDGSSVTLSDDKYTLNNVSVAHMIAVSFTNTGLTNMTVTYPANPNGQIVTNFYSPQTLSHVTVQVAAPSAPNTWYTLSGNYSFSSGGNNTYTVSLPANSFPPYTLVMINSQSPQQIFYTVAASTGSNGTISPSGTFSVGSGSSQTFTVTPNTGYVPSVTVDGVAVTLSDNTYTLNNITAVHTIAVSYAAVAGNVYVQAINYNANGQITQIQYGNGTTTAYTYDPLMFRLTRIYTSNAQAQIIQNLNYTYDSTGQVLTIKDNANTGVNSMTQTFAYDALNRLVAASGSYGSKTYAYDSIGNITQKDGLTYTYTGAGPHAVTSLSDGSAFQYDANGNMVSLQKGSNLTQYAYDSQNRLQSVTVGGLTAATYVYDGDGGRTQKTVYRRDLALYNDNVNTTLFDSVTNPLPATAANPTIDTTIDVGNLYETESGTSRNTKFIYLGSTRIAAVGSDGTVMFYHTDHLGGTNVLTDQTGVVRELTVYDPFGQVIIHEKYGNNFATAWYYFTGKPLDDETGLVFLGSRYYNPSLGRFITPDTIVPSASDPQTLNRYSYCLNNPVNMIDPDGHKSWWSNFWHSVGKIFEGIGIAIAGAILTAVSGGVLAPVIGAFMSGVITGAIAGATIGGASSAILGGDIGQDILIGAIGGAIFGGIGGLGFSGPEEVEAHIAGGAASGAIGGAISGGNVGIDALSGGLSAGASEWAGEGDGPFKFTGNYMTDVVKQAALGGIVGGGVSAAFGGSFGEGFENGAETSAIAFTANDTLHGITGAIAGGIGGAIAGSSSAAIRGESPFWGGVKGFVGGAGLGAVLGYFLDVTPPIGAASGVASSYGGQVVGNVVNGSTNPYTHISWGAVIGAGVGGGVGIVAEQGYMELGFSRYSAAILSGGVTGVSEQQGDLIGKSSGGY